MADDEREQLKRQITATLTESLMGWAGAPDDVVVDAAVWLAVLLAERAGPGCWYSECPVPHDAGLTEITLRFWRRNRK